MKGAFLYVIFLLANNLFSLEEMPKNFVCSNTTAVLNNPNSNTKSDWNLNLIPIQFIHLFSSLQEKGHSGYSKLDDYKSHAEKLFRRYLEKHPNLQTNLTLKSYIKIVLVAIIIVIKIAEDESYYISDLFSYIDEKFPDCFSLKEFIQAETEFLQKINWNVAYF
jgi:hypothetical protein